MPPFVFLPGTLCDSRVWQHQTEAFMDHYVVNLRTQTTLEAMLDSVDDVPLPTFILVGFSMGGYVAQEFALRYPERVQQLVIVGTSSEGYPPAEKEVVLKALPLLEKGIFRGITEKRLREFLHPESYENPGIRQTVLSMAGPDAKDVYLRQLKATLDRRDLSDFIGSVNRPITVVAGKQDRIVPIESVRRTKKYAPHARIHELDSCGHFVPLEKPRELNALLKALSGS